MTEEKRTSLRVGSSDCIFNLPELILMGTGKSIMYTYNAAGQKVKKFVVDETTTPETQKEVDYLDGFQYAGQILQFFPHSEGYVSATPSAVSIGSPPTSYAYNYVYNYTDHLGNVRLSYTKDPVNNQLKVLEENNYYPFGLKHSVYNTGKMDFEAPPEQGIPPVLNYVTKTKYDYKFGAKEWQDELGLNWYDYGARNYDPALGRWMNIDPLTDQNPGWTPYRYAFNNPMIFVDPTGMLEDIYELDGEGNLTNIAESDRDVVYASENFEGEGGNRALKADNDGGVDVGEKGFVENNKGSINLASGETHDFINFGSNEDTALNFFKYAAENTSVEFNVFTENGVSFSGTTHLEGAVHANFTNAENVTMFGHSHPLAKSSSIAPSGVEIYRIDGRSNEVKSSIWTTESGDMKMLYKNNFKIDQFIYAPNYLDGAKTVFYNKGGMVSPIKNGFQPK